MCAGWARFPEGPSEAARIAMGTEAPCEHTALRINHPMGSHAAVERGHVDVGAPALPAVFALPPTPCQRRLSAEPDPRGLSGQPGSSQRPVCFVPPGRCPGQTDRWRDVKLSGFLLAAGGKCLVLSESGRRGSCQAGSGWSLPAAGGLLGKPLTGAAPLQVTWRPQRSGTRPQGPLHSLPAPGLPHGPQAGVGTEGQDPRFPAPAPGLLPHLGAQLPPKVTWQGHRPSSAWLAVPLRGVSESPLPLLA